ncbi:hypothetical protein R6Q57_011484 [Mikania cordata]
MASCPTDQHRKPPWLVDQNDNGWKVHDRAAGVHDGVICIPSERLALIDLKNNLTDPANRLSSWVGNDCCIWSGVVCDNFTGHVHEIRLRGPDDGIHGQCNAIYVTDHVASSHMLGGNISLSIIKLSQLRYLDLSCNDFGSSPIPAFIGSFQSLVYLNISQSQFSGEIPHQLGNLSTLCVLDLYVDSDHSNLHSKSLKWLKNFKGLLYLDMTYVDLSKASDWITVISNLTSLLELHFASCQLGQLPGNPTTVSFTSLIVLDLSYNFFYRSMLPGWIFSLRNLALLDLSNSHISGLSPGTHGGFHNMPSLRTLRVSGNTFMNSSSLLNGLGSLSNLRLIDVRECDISSPILGSVQNLSFIESLYLSRNQISEEIPKSFSNICNLTTLDLQSNKFYGNVSKLLETFCECESPKLELLAFGDNNNNNNLIGQLPERLGKLKNLASIDLASSQLTGTLPNSLGSLSLLKTLDISGNQLSGSIPNTIGGLISLVSLDLSHNMLNGSLPESIGRLNKLSSLSLHHNSLTGIVIENHFVDLTALESLWIGDNKLVFKFHVNNWIPPFKLETLLIGSCSLGPKFPSWIQSQTGGEIELRELDIANTNISDTIPNWFWTTFSGITYLNISHNNIEGKLGDLRFYALGAVLDLSNNRLHGMLPDSFNEEFMEFLDLSNNNLSGSLQKFLCSPEDEVSLNVLNLANNSMSGVIPDCWMNWPSLIILNLENNHFSGIIPSSLGNISSLQSLNMDGNRLSGNLSPSLLNSNSLAIIELAENELTGTIPTSIGRGNTSLRVVSLRSNKFEGKIPAELCHLSSIQILDLADNNLSGNLPTCFWRFRGERKNPSRCGRLVFDENEASSPIVLMYTYFDRKLDVKLVTKGNTYIYSTILYLVTSLDLSNNKFSGSIPDEIVRLSGLLFLNLSHNDLTGTIPNLFNKTGKLECLDLSMNRLNGNIPLSLSQLSALSCLNVSYNNLVGRIPTGPQFHTFNESSFTGNALCGDPLPACLPNNDNNTEEFKDRHDEADGIDWILVILTLAGLVVGFWIILIPLFLSKRWRKAYFHFLERIWFKLQSFTLILFLCKS